VILNFSIFLCLLLFFEYSTHCVILFCKQTKITSVYIYQKWICYSTSLFFLFFYKALCSLFLYSINTFESRNNKRDYDSVVVSTCQCMYNTFVTFDKIFRNNHMLVFLCLMCCWRQWWWWWRPIVLKEWN
jgi:hypothetical protein